METIYLDYNATTPIDPRVAAAVQPFVAQHFGNPSSQHAFGRITAAAMETARGEVAALLGCDSGEIIFTSGGSESNNLAIKGLADAHPQRRHIITSAVEHPAVSEVCRYLAAKGYRVTTLPVDESGRVAVTDVRAALTPDTLLISIMHANNEVGTIQPIAEIGALARANRVFMHTDAAQSLGKIPVDVASLNVDLLSIAGHKLYAHKGIGALYVRSGIAITPQTHGAGHEGGRRAGTENVLLAVGLGAACRLIPPALAGQMAHMAALRDRLHAGICARIADVRLNGHPEQRLPNTLNLSFRRLPANAVIARMEGLAVSAGAACHADRVELSATLAAMGVPADDAMGAVRFSVGRMTTAAEVDHAVDIVCAAAEGLSAGR